MSRESWTMLKRAVARFELDTGMSVDIQATMNGIKQFSYSTPSLESMVRGQQVRRGNNHSRGYEIGAQSVPTWGTDSIPEHELIPRKSKEADIDFDEPLSDDDPVDDLDLDGVDLDDDNDEFDQEVSKPREMMGRTNPSPYDRNDNFASSAPVLIGTPSRGIRRQQEDDFDGAESYYGSALHKEHVRQSLQKNN